MPINENLQKSGENNKTERHNSFALYGKRNGLLQGSKSGNHQNQINQYKREQSNADNILPREPNETTIMKARPSTSFRVANKSHGFNT